ncbi:hypothetical protein [Spiroplasma endosymbiont of Asaphidion curtum]|uniref:hypothetical protein n=1 Tax=Spiroplasma endosymbiont of Asaphidion curtum TaxID=3066281 RepID=UPI00313A77BE
MIIGKKQLDNIINMINYRIKALNINYTQQNQKEIFNFLQQLIAIENISTIRTYLENTPINLNIDQSIDLVHNYNILYLPNYKIHFRLCIYLTFVLHLGNNIIKIVDKIKGYVPSLMYFYMLNKLARNCVQATRYLDSWSLSHNNNKKSVMYQRDKVFAELYL